MPDLLFHNGPIYTLDPQQPLVDALLVRDDRIISVGPAPVVRSVIEGHYEEVNLNGHALMPGLTDAHIHLMWTGLNALSIDLDEVASLNVALDRIAAHAAQLPDGAWVRGHGWNHALWGNRWPTAADLDRVTAGHPALLSRKDGHSVWLNSAGLQLAGVDAATGDPSGGAIQRDAQGEPNGILLETANDLGYDAVPDYTYAEKRTAMQQAIAHCHRLGLTSLHMPEGPAALAIFRDLRDANELRIRGLCHLRYNQLDQAIELGLRSGLGDEWVRVGGVKIFSDGSLGSCTCHMLAPFVGTESNYGLPTVPEEELHAAVIKAATNGIALAIHAIGDRANRNVLDALSHPAVRAAHCAMPHRIEHAQHLDPADIDRFAQLGVVASMQPIHATADMEIAERLLGRERCASSYAWQPLLRSGAILAFGSDAPVETFDPWRGIHAAVTRQRPDNTPPGGWHPELAISLQAALDAYTLGPTHASAETALKGALIAGKFADLVVLDADPFAIPSAELQRVRVLQTVVGGQSVWEAPA